MGVVNTSLGAIGVEQSGEGGTPLLFLHGVGSDRHAWRRQLDHFGRERHTLAIDYPGYGDSAFIAGATRTTFAEAVLAVLDAVGIERAHVCGLSLGGVVAIRLAALAPERIESLILADSFARHPEGQAIHDRSLAGAAELGMAGLAEARADALLAQPADRTIREEVVATMSRIDPAAYAVAAEAVWLAEQQAEAAAITAPAMIVYGSEDRITPASLSEQLKELIPHAGLIEIGGAGHLPNLEQPAIFNRVVAAFLSEVERKV